jgi:hypothetical protein
MSDAILNGSNPAADRRLINAVLSAADHADKPDPFDGGCPSDCNDRHPVSVGDDHDIPKEHRKALAFVSSWRKPDDAALTERQAHQLYMQQGGFISGWLCCIKAIRAEIASRGDEWKQLDATARVQFEMLMLGLAGEPMSKSEDAFRANWIEHYSDINRPTTTA